MEAGNTVETLSAVDVNEAAPARGFPEDNPAPSPVPDTEDISEFEKLRNLVTHLFERIERYNLGAPHKI